MIVSPNMLLFVYITRNVRTDCAVARILQSLKVLADSAIPAIGGGWRIDLVDLAAVHLHNANANVEYHDSILWSGAVGQSLVSG